MTTETAKRTPLIRDLANEIDAKDRRIAQLERTPDEEAYIWRIEQMAIRIAQLEAALREIITVSTTTVYPKESLDRARSLLDGKS